MIDRFALKLLRPVIDGAARRAAGFGITADQATLIGFSFGMAAALLIVLGHTWTAILPLLANRAIDGRSGLIRSCSISSLCR